MAFGLTPRTLTTGTTTSMTELKVAKVVLGTFLLGCAGLFLYGFITEPIGMLVLIGAVVAFFGLMWSAMVIGEHYK